MPAFINNRQTGSAVDAKPVTPSNSVDLPDGPARAIFVGAAGDLSIVTGGGSTVTLVGLSAGQLVPLMAVRVRSTGTTATNIIAFY